jgi:hypothetical protein
MDDRNGLSRRRKVESGNAPTDGRVKKHALRKHGTQAVRNKVARRSLLKTTVLEGFVQIVPSKASKAE